MVVKFTEKGAQKGRISVMDSARTMSVGETWVLDIEGPRELVNVRVNCSRLGSETGRFYSVALKDKDSVVITRTI